MEGGPYYLPIIFTWSEMPTPINTYTQTILWVRNLSLKHIPRRSLLPGAPGGERLGKDAGQVISAGGSGSI